MTKEELKNKKIAVLGAGVEGLALIEFLKTYTDSITVLIEKPEEEIEDHTLQEIKNLDLPVIFGESAFENLEEYEVIFRSPGVKRRQETLDSAFQNGVVISSQTQLFFDLCPCPIIGVTGTKGKGTTSSLIYEMLKTQGYDTYLGGNIGTPPISFLEKLTPESRVVLEMSSFQLQDLTSSPHIAVMLMTTSEHLDYHADVYEYIDAKRNIFRFQKSTDFAIMNRDYPASNESDLETDAKVYKVSRDTEVLEGCFVKDNQIVLKIDEKEEEVMDTKDILLPGRHNLENVCAAVMAAYCAGVKIPAIVDVLKTFKGLEHRLELTATIHGIRFYDDSFSTTPETAIAAIEAFTEPEILLLGGSSKNSDFTQLGQVISGAKNIKAIIKIGEEWEKIKESIKGKLAHVQIIEDCDTMQEAVKKAASIAENGDVILLTPACASFDKFKNYKDRGQQFKQAVRDL